MKTPGRMIGVAALLLSLTTGCGRDAGGEARPQPLPLEFSSAAASSETLTGSLNDGGSVLVVSVQASGFRTTGAYSMYAFERPFGRRVGVGSPPYTLPVAADGTVSYRTQVASRRGAWGDAAWDRLVVYYHANGDANDMRSAVVVATAPLPLD